MNTCKCGKETDNDKELCEVCKMGATYDSDYSTREQYRDYGSNGKEQFEMDFEKY